MKIHILYKFQSGPWGGGNQFLRALKKEFIKLDLYEENLEKTEILLLNSHHHLATALKLKSKYPHKIIIYRLNGPISLIRGRDEEIDKLITFFNQAFADGIIWQSSWCREQNKKLFRIFSKYETVIHNAPDNDIFNKKNKKEFNSKHKIRLIATSWSSNWRKGFDIYKYLDANLDFSKYEMTFVGNLPIEFKNINQIKPVFPKELAEILKEHDIFITASQNDPCSNALIEALSCGLPAVVLDNGGHPELIQKGGELFKGKKDVIEKIEKVAQNYTYYQSKIPKFSLKKTAMKYYQFAKKIYNDVHIGKYRPKQINFSAKINFYKIKSMILMRRIMDKFM